MADINWDDIFYRMYDELLLWIRTTNIDSASKLILYTFTALCNHNMNCIVEISEIVEATSLSRSTVSNRLKKLKDLKLITVSKGYKPDGSLLYCLYQLHPEIDI